MKARRSTQAFLVAAVAACLVAIGGSASAQVPTLQSGAFPGTTPPSSNLLRSGLLDFSRFDVSQSLSFGYSSGFGGNRSAGLWVTELGYRVSNPLRVSVDVGAVLDPSGQGSFLNEKSFFLKGFNVDYRPSKNFLLNISYVNLPSSAAPALGYRLPGYGPYRGSPLGFDR
jgi:hypothetical protein